MGGGSFNTRAYNAKAATFKQQNKQEIFSQRVLASEFDPLNVKLRESRASKEHPDPTSIIITCDVTGSMGKIPENLIKGALGTIMESLTKIQSISNPQIMFAAIGDTETDKAPLQVTQFESDNRIVEQLKKLYLEGGGGGNKSESYHAVWYFAARKTQLDSLKGGKKGLLFTLGDELVPKVLKGDHIREFIDKDYKGGDILTSQLVREVSEKYDVFHIIVQDTSTYSQIGAATINACWQQYLGERALSVAVYTDIPDKIIATVRSLCEVNKEISKVAQSSSSIAIADIASSSAVASSSAAYGSSATTDNKMGTTTSAAVQASNLGLFVHKISASAPPASSASVLNQDNDGTPYLFKCALSLDVMDDPVIAEDGKTYERREIERWFEGKTSVTSPKTNQVIGKLLISNDDLRSEIMRWKEERERAKQSLSGPATK